MAERSEKLPEAPIGDRRDAWGRRGRLLWPVVIFVTAAGLRLLYLVQFSRSPLFWAPIMDAQYHDEWAQRLAAGDWIGREAFFRAPLYPYFLGAIYALFGPSPLVARALQALIGSASCVLVFLLGRRQGGQSVGILAGLGCAAYAPLIYFDAELLLPVLEVLFGVAGLLALSRAWEQPGRRRWFTAGLCLGLFAITRPNILPFAAFAVAACAVHCRSRRLRGLPEAAALAFGIILPIAPVAIRNWVVAGDFVPISWQGGVNLYIGNNPESDGSTAILPGTRPTWWGGYHDALRIAQEHEGRELKPSEVSGFWARRSLDAVRAQPGRWLRLMGRKLGLFWHGFELSNNEVVYANRRESSLLRALLWSAGGVSFPFGLLAPLALLGMVVAARRWREWLLLYGYVLCYSASVILFFVADRFRIPVVPVLALFAAYALIWLRVQVRERAWRSVAPALALLLAMAWVTNTDFYGVDSVDAAKGHCDRGGAWMSLGRWKESEREYRQALALRPDYLPHLLGLARACTHTGKLSESEALCRKAMQLAPEAAEPHLEMASLLEIRGRGEEAGRERELAVRLDPSAVQGLLPLARSSSEAGRLDEAAGLYDQVLRADPNCTDAYEGLGECRQKQGMLDAAADAYRRAVELDPSAWQTRVHLASCYARLNRAGEAIRQYEQAVRGGGQRDGRAWFLLGIAYELDGRAQDAVRAYERALHVQPRGRAAGDARRRLEQLTGAR